MKTAQNKEISFCFLLSKSSTWILWRYQTANFDTDVGNTKTVPKNFNYYSLYTCPPLFYFLIFTARKRSLGKVVFSQASVCPRGRGSPWQRLPWTENPLDRYPLLDRDPPGQRPPGKRSSGQTPFPTVKSGRYTSYWNAFLLFCSSFDIINWAERSISPVNKPIKDVEPGFIYDHISTSTLPHSVYLKYFWSSHVPNLVPGYTGKKNLTLSSL